MNDIKFCVFSTTRSGSTWLISLLKNHPEIHAEGEILLPGRNEYKNFFSIQTNDNVSEGIVGKLRLSARKILRARNFILMKIQSDANKKAAGFKLIYGQLWKNPGVLHSLVRDRFRVVHLVRENYLDVVISRALVAKSGVAHSPALLKKQKQGNTPLQKAKSVYLDTEDLLYQIKRLDRIQKVAKLTAMILPCKILRVTYEELKEDPRAVLNRIYDFLDMSLPPEDVSVKSRLEKLNKASHAESIENFDEVRAVLIKSSFGKFIPDAV